MIPAAKKKQNLQPACNSRFSSRFCHNKFLMALHTKIRFFSILFYELKNACITAIYFSSLFTNKRAVLLSAPNDQLQFSFPAGFWHEIEHALSGAGFWHQKNLTAEKYDRLTCFWYQLTGTRNRRQKLASVSSLLVPSKKLHTH